MSGVLERYVAEIKDLDPSAPPENIRTLVSAIYELPDQRPRFAPLFNNKFENWVQSRTGLEALDALQMPSGLSADESIPAASVVKVVVETTVPGAIEWSNNLLRRKIIIDNWDDENALPFVQILVKMLQGLQSVNEYGREVEFVVESILLRNELVYPAEAAQLWNLIPPLYSRIADPLGREEICRLAVVFAVRSRDANVIASAQNFLDGSWRVANDLTQRKILEFARTFENPEASSLMSILLAVDLQTIRNEKEAPSDRTVQRVALVANFLDRLPANSLFPTNSLSDLFMESLVVSSDDSLQKWLQIIESHRADLDLDFQARFADRCLELVLSAQYDQARSAILLKAMMEAVGKLSVDRKRDLIQKYFELLKNPNVHIRNAASMVIGDARTALSDSQELRIRCGNVLSFVIREVGDQQLASFHPVVIAVIQQDDVFSEDEWAEASRLGRRLLSSPDISMQEFGLTVVERIPEILLKSEIVHLLTGLESSGSVHLDRITRKLNQLREVQQQSTEEARRSEESDQPG